MKTDGKRVKYSKINFQKLRKKSGISEEMPKIAGLKDVIIINAEDITGQIRDMVFLEKNFFYFLKTLLFNVR